MTSTAPPARAGSTCTSDGITCGVTITDSCHGLPGADTAPADGEIAIGMP